MKRGFSAIEAYAEGEPGRVIVGGVAEPRGYPAANCNVPLPPTTAEADAGYVIKESAGYP